jgi:hypothetical protein
VVLVEFYFTCWYAVLSLSTITGLVYLFPAKFASFRKTVLEYQMIRINWKENEIADRN